MPFKRETIVATGAIAGAQLLAFILHPLPGETTSSCLQWANDAVDGASYNLNRAVNPPKIPEGLTEGEYNQYREIFKTDNIRVTPARVASRQVAAPTAQSKPAVVPNDGRNYWEHDVWADRQPQAAPISGTVSTQPVASAPVPAVSMRAYTGATASMDRALDQEIAHDRGLSLAQYRANPSGGQY